MFIYEVKDSQIRRRMSTLINFFFDSSSINFIKQIVQSYFIIFLIYLTKIKKKRRNDYRLSYCYICWIPSHKSVPCGDLHNILLDNLKSSNKKKIIRLIINLMPDQRFSFENEQNGGL